MNRHDMEELIISTLKGTTQTSLHNEHTMPDSFSKFINSKVEEKTVQQLEYILSPINEDVFLEACAGSGKTEVVGMKMSYEIKKWHQKNCGMAVLTFTNEATDTIKSRVAQFSKVSSLHPHYIGTITGFIHGLVAQKFGYRYFQRNSEDGDRSYRLIDKNLMIFNNHWLEKYKLPYTNINASKQDAYANQLYFDYETNDFILYYSESIKFSLREYYNTDKFQEFILGYRKKMKNDTLLSYEFIREKIREVKQNFFKDGFANFEDMNNMAYWILKKNPQIASLIAARFPVIFIDECQDLSWIEINILHLLKSFGAILHFIGDLNQSIYEFKNANPEFTKKSLSGFKKFNLTDNFRSCHSIVETANKILAITLPIRGLETNKLGDRSVCYLEYQDVKTLGILYMKFLKQVDISPNRATILVRQQSLKSNMESGSNESKHAIIDALHLWKENSPKARLLALELTGKQLQKYFGGAKTKKHYYCPNSINSVFRWRIFIKDFLEECSSYPELLTYDNLEYSAWYKIFNKYFPIALQESYGRLNVFDNQQRDFSSLPTYRTPQGTAKEIISPVTINDSIDLIPINTIHSVKGKDYDGVMVVSSQRNSGSGHWKQWIEKDREASRISYVANTRAKYSLVWAVPKLTEEDRSKIESFGFKRIELMIE